MSAIPPPLSRRLAPPLCAILALSGASPLAHASQERIFRCGNLYTNADKSGEAGCEPVAVDRISVVQSQPASTHITDKHSASADLGKSSRSTVRVSSLEQRQKDTESRQILETEWRKTKSRLQDLIKEYNNGEPERLGAEHSNPQKYLERVAALKSSITRTEADLSGIRRELARMGVTPQP